jgi:hypothetical protein
MLRSRKASEGTFNVEGTVFEGAERGMDGGEDGS